MTNVAVVEVTKFETRSGEEELFRRGMEAGLPILVRQEGYISHEFGTDLDQPLTYWLTVHWQTLQHHTEGFQKSADFQAFVANFRPYLTRPASLSHFSPE